MVLPSDSSQMPDVLVHIQRVSELLLLLLVRVSSIYLFIFFSNHEILLSWLSLEIGIRLPSSENCRL